MLARAEQGWPGTRIALELETLRIRLWGRATVNNYIRENMGARRARKANPAPKTPRPSAGGVRTPAPKPPPEPELAEESDTVTWGDVAAASEEPELPSAESGDEMPSVSAAPPKAVPEGADLATYDWLIHKAREQIAVAEESGNGALGARWATVLAQTVSAKRRAMPPDAADVNKAPDYIKLSERVDAEMHRLLAKAIGDVRSAKD